MPLREQDRHFLWSLYSAVAIIFIWKGLWEGIYEIPYFGDPFVFLFIGLAMLTFWGVIFREFDPLGGLEKSIDKVLHLVYNHPHKEDFQIKYYDKSRKEHRSIGARNLKGFEKGALVLQHEHKRQEVFIPLHRVTEIMFKGKSYWRL